MRDLFFSNGMTGLVERWDEIKLKGRGRLLFWSFQPARQKLINVPVVTFADFMRFPTGVLHRRHPVRYLKFLINFWSYRRSLRGQTWLSLSMIYPRPLILWYYYLLFWWAEYCGVLPQFYKHPEHSIIPELFINYIIKVDSIIDGEGGEEYLHEGIPYVKRECSNILNELLVRIRESKGFDENKRKSLSDKIWKFRHNSLIVSRDVQRHPVINFEGLLEYKDRTAGDLFRVWVDLLCEVYDVRQCQENSKKVFGGIAMAIQVIDDMLDSPVDYHGNVWNIFVDLLRKTPIEFNIARGHFENFPRSYLDWTWANKNLPITSKKAVQLITCYINDIVAISKNQSMTSELCEIMADWRVHNSNTQAGT